MSGCKHPHVSSNGQDGWQCTSCHVSASIQLGMPAAVAARITAKQAPFVVGDYVRWERGPDAPWNWAQGEIIEVSLIAILVQIEVQAPERSRRDIGQRRWLGIEKNHGGVAHRVKRPPVDPLYVEYDGIPLGTLLHIDIDGRQDMRTAKAWGHTWTPAQRAAVSTHWSAQLRAKVAASDAGRKSREVSVLCQGDYDDEEPWWPQ